MRCMCFDGGGVLGVGPAHLLELWEQDSGKPAHSLAQAYAGTSTGSILAAGLAFGKPAAEMVELYLNRSKDIFRKRNWLSRLNSHKYYGDGLRDVLIEIFGTLTMADSPVPLLICASDFVGGEKDGLTDFYTPTTHPNLHVAEAIRRSCSAPTYFPAVGGRYADGGLFANNPSLALVVHLSDLGYEPRDLELLSFGTGGKHWRPRALSGKSTLASAGDLIAFILSAATARVVHRYCESVGLAWYRRLSPDVGAPELDDLGRMREWMGVWGVLWNREGRGVLATFLYPHVPEDEIEQARRMAHLPPKS